MECQSESVSPLATHIASNRQCGSDRTLTLLQQNQSDTEQDAIENETFIIELIAMVYERGEPFSMTASTVLYSVERYWQERHDKPNLTRMDNRPKGSAETGKFLKKAKNYLYTQGVSVEDTYIKGNRALRFSLNENANRELVGSNPQAGKVQFTGSEPDVSDQRVTDPGRSEAEWAVILAELDSMDSTLH